MSAAGAEAGPVATALARYYDLDLRDDPGDVEMYEALAKRAGEIDPNDVAPITLANLARYKGRYEDDLKIRGAKEHYVIDAYKDVDRSCRSFTHTIYLDGRPQTVRSTACRNPDGTWSSVG